jgi:glycolate oxidase iron-sulfur subunit
MKKAMRKKIRRRKMTVESDNAKEDVREEVSKCIKCGLCKENDSIFKVFREERVSSRGKAVMLENDIYDKVLYEETLSMAGDFKCPIKINLTDSFIKARKVLVDAGKGISVHKEMIENLKKSGNIFGMKDE